MIRILFFGPIADRTRCREMSIDYTPGMVLGDGLQTVGDRYPDALELISFMALNGEQIRNPETALSDGDEIAFMAKFSGG